MRLNYPIISSTKFGLNAYGEFGVRHFITQPEYISKKTVLEYGLGFTISIPVKWGFWPLDYFPIPIGIKWIDKHYSVYLSYPLYVHRKKR